MLAVDYDPQGNLSFSFGADMLTSPTMYHVINGDISIKEAIQHMPQGDIIVGNASLTKIVHGKTRGQPKVCKERPESPLLAPAGAKHLEKQCDEEEFCSCGSERRALRSLSGYLRSTSLLQKHCESVSRTNPA